MKSLFVLFLIIPGTTLAQIATPGDKTNETKGIAYHSENVRPVEVNQGNATEALFKVVFTKVGGDSCFDIIIYTRSYRDALVPSDNEALVIVDGLGKTFKIHRWTSRDHHQKVTGTIVLRMNKDEFKSIGYGGTVGVVVGENYFNFSHKERHDMRNLVSQVESRNGRETDFLSPVPGIKVIPKTSNPKPGASEFLKKLDRNNIRVY